jgi:transcriptional regulator with XRE-family HTH domain
MSSSERKKEPELELGALPARLRQIIRHSGMSQNAFARAIGYDPGEFSKLVNAEPHETRIAAIAVNTLVRAARVGRVRVGWLIAGEPPASVEELPQAAPDDERPPSQPSSSADVLRHRESLPPR